MHLFKELTNGVGAVAIVIAALVVACLSGCRANEPEPGTGPEGEDVTSPLLFMASTPGDDDMTTTPASRRSDATRAATYVDLQTLYPHFGVYAYKTMQDLSTQDVLRYGSTAPYLPYEVVRDEVASKWTYDIVSDDREQYLRYWDLSAKQYRFEGVAPFRVGDVAVVEAPYGVHVADGKIHISNVSGNVSTENAVDWMTASHLRDYSEAPDVIDTDLVTGSVVKYPAKLTDLVDLRFHHILSLIEVRAYNDETTDLSLTSMDIKFKRLNPAFDAGEEESESNPKYLDDFIYTSGDYVSDPGDTEWTFAEASKTDVLYSLPDGTPMLVTGDDQETANTLLSQLELPQSMTGKYLSIEIKTAQKTFSGVFSLTPSGGWESGMKYVYYIHLSNNEEVILASVNMEEFRWKQGNTIAPEENDELNNW